MDTHEKSDEMTKPVKAGLIDWLSIVTGAAVLLCLFAISASHWKVLKDILPEEATLNLWLDKLVSGCIALLAILLGLERRTELARLKKNIQAQSDAMDRIAKRATAIEQGQKKLVSSTEFLQRSIELSNHPTFPDIVGSAIHAHVPEPLRVLFPGVFHDYEDMLTTAINERKYPFKDKTLFDTAYREWLLAHPRTHICATSSASPDYYWTKEGDEDSPLETAIRAFIQEGGTMERLFFLLPDALKDKDVVSRLNKQCSLGVNVFYTIVEEEQKDFFIIDRNECLLLRIYVHQGAMNNFSASTNPNAYKSFSNKWDVLMKSATTTHFRPKV